MCLIDLFDLLDGSDESRKILEAQATAVNFRHRRIYNDRLTIGVYVDPHACRLSRRLVNARQLMLRRSHLPNCCACSRAITWLRPPPKLNCSMLRMSHGLCASVGATRENSPQTGAL